MTGDFKSGSQEMQTFNEMKRKKDCINCLETAENPYDFTIKRQF